MSPVVLAVLAFLCIGAFGVALVPSILAPSRAEKRRQALRGDYQAHRMTSAVNAVRENRRKTVQEALKAQSEELKRRRKTVSLQMRIHQAGLKTRKSAFIRNSIIFAALLFAACTLLRVPVYFGAVIAAAAGYAAPLWFLSFRRKRYQASFIAALPDAIEAIVRGIKSGMPLNDSIRLVAREAKEPVRSEFARIVDQQAVGKTMMEAVEVLYERIPLPEVNFFVVVIAVQQQAGGNLAEALGNLSRVLRDRKKLKAKVKALSAEATASAMIIGALPVVVAGLVALVSPGYLLPLISTRGGMMALGACGFMMLMGVGFMYRMIQFEV